MVTTPAGTTWVGAEESMAGADFPPPISSGRQKH